MSSKFTKNGGGMKKSFGIIGGGLSGVSAALTLAFKHNAQVTLYESGKEIGGAAPEIAVLFDGRSVAADADPVFFTPSRHIYLHEAVRRFEIPCRKIAGRLPSLFSDAEYDWVPGKNGRGAGGLYALSARFREFQQEIVRFYRQLQEIPVMRGGVSLKEFLFRNEFSSDFHHKFLQPILCETQAGSGAFNDFPAFPFLRSVCDLLPVPSQDLDETIIIPGGLNGLMRPLREALRPFTRTETRALKIVRVGETVFVHDSKGGTEAFDKVIFACGAPAILQALGAGATPEESAALSALQTERVTGYVHCDETLIGGNGRKVTERYFLAAQEYACVTYHLGKFSYADRPPALYLTKTPIFPLREDKIFEIMYRDRPVFNKETVKARNRLTLLNGLKNTYYHWANAEFDTPEDRMKAGAMTAEQAVG